MPTCRIIFAGLCAFVPHGGELLDPNDPPSSITALLPNVLAPFYVPPPESEPEPEPEPLSDSYPPPVPWPLVIVPPHFPLLEFKLKDIALEDTVDFLEFRKSIEFDEKGIYPLVAKEVEIWIDGAPPEPPQGIECVHRPQDPYQDDDLYWLIRLEKYYPKPCAIKPELLESLLGQDDLVTTRITLTAGAFSTYEVTLEEWFPKETREIFFAEEVPIARDRRTSPSYSAEDYRKVAVKVALEFDFEREVAFVIKGFGGKDPRTLIFAPPADRSYDTVDLVVKNLEANEHFGLSEYLDTYIGFIKKNGKKRGVLIQPDFSIYEKLVRFKEDGYHPIVALLSFLSSGGFGKPCSPVSVPQNLPAQEVTTVGQAQETVAQAQEKIPAEKGFSGRATAKQVAPRRQAGRRGK